MTCSKCGSDKVIPRTRVIDRAHYGTDSGNVRIGVERNPAAFIFRFTEHADLYARLCGVCGLVELYVEHPAQIYRVYEESQQRSK